MNGSAAPSPIPYSADDERADRERGRHEGQAGMPDVVEWQLLIDMNTGPLPIPLPTPGARDYDVQAKGMADSEVIACESDIGNWRAETANLHKKIEAVKQRALRAEEYAAEAAKAAQSQLTADDLLSRNDQERQLSPEDLRGQRMGEREAVADRARLAHSALEQEVGQMSGRLAELEQLMGDRREIKNKMVLRIYAHFGRRLNAYWAGVGETHDRGSAISVVNLELRPPPELFN